VDDHQVVAPDEWLSVRKEFLVKGKEFNRLRDQLSQQRRDLPWEPVDKEYVFDGPDGKQTLAELFDGRSQLIVYHFMFAPDWDAGCPSSSLWADNFEGIPIHLNHRDVTFVAISRAPYSKLAAYEQRMGWTFKWLSSSETDFNFDYHASFTPEQVANKKAFYNYETQDPGATDHASVSVFAQDEYVPLRPSRCHENPSPPVGAVPQSRSTVLQKGLPVSRGNLSRPPLSARASVEPDQRCGCWTEGVDSDVLDGHVYLPAVLRFGPGSSMAPLRARLRVTHFRESNR
jgi:predicted dithiol-disulfide oxidoreductase (DUF899 family)